MLTAKPPGEHSPMPITLTQVDTDHEIDAGILTSVVKDLPDSHAAVAGLQRWLQSPSDGCLYLAWFNERVVGFALLEGRQLRSLAVHPATRRRGVARRMMSLLMTDGVPLSLSPDCQSEVLTRLLAENASSPSD
ncbi:GNAT family N-acetyltransferase [Reinekea blandensis]|uniref:Imidazoleglycerol-phosphate dehydratase n=1 Tax=Reinekea blandensis MED297 TaxID=314283 RepID=A4BFU8_9GAMM|nr:GNAT family N-acetyltransferase [Reinekea blandensis]EAR08966.1 imidazoleglycerol-phosphate dehydratase [Reinekea sp. MED297] [Reinekea blandensis MED297]